MSVEKVKFTSESIATSQKKLNDNFTALELEDAKKQEIMQYSTMPSHYFLIWKCFITYILNAFWNINFYKYRTSKSIAFYSFYSIC